MQIGVTGPRRLTRTQEQVLKKLLPRLLGRATELHVGDATGVDALVLELGEKAGVGLHQYFAGGDQPWMLQARSKRMVDNLADRGGILYAFPNKPCPVGLHPQKCTSWLGSGTWGTVCYAASKGVRVELHPLTEDAKADWMEVKQLSLF